MYQAAERMSILELRVARGWLLALTARVFLLTAAKLKAWTEANGYRVVSQPLSAGYDPSWTLPFLRRNEV